MPRQPRWLYALLVLGTLATARAQEITDLATLNRAAQRHNPSLVAARHNIAAARAQLDEARISPFFQFEAETAVTLAPEARGTPLLSDDDDFPIGNQWRPVVRAGIEGAIPLWTFGKLSAARDAARAGVRAAERQRDHSRDQLRFDVRRAYYALQLALDTQQMIGEGHGKLEKAQQQLEERLQDGDPEVHPNDRYRLAAALAEVRGRRSQAVGLERGARAALRTLTGLPHVQVPDCPLEPVAFEPEAAADRYAALGRAHRPELGALDAAVAARRAKLDATRARYFPDLALVLGASISHAPGVTDQENPFVYDPANRETFGAALVARWKLDLWGNSFRDARAESKLRETEAQKRMAVQGLELEVRRAYEELGDARRRLSSWRRGRIETRKWFVASAQAYDVGVGEPKELIDAMKAYFSARFAELEATRDFNQSVANLERVTGVALVDEATWNANCLDGE